MGKEARGVHRGEGISLMTYDEIAKLLVKYQYGAGCSKEQPDNFIVQKYIPNPLLINGKKFDFRCFIILASMDPLIVFYQDGIVRIAAEEYDESSHDVAAHLTNLAVSKENLANQTEETEQTMEDQAWTMQQFEDYLVATGRVNNNYFKEVMVPRMKEIIMHTVRSVSEKLLRHPGVYELFGIDLMLDDDLNLWLLEVTPLYHYDAATQMTGDLKMGILRNLTEMQFAMMLGKWDVFDNIQRQSGFEYVYDGRKTGMERYHGIIRKECL